MIRGTAKDVAAVVRAAGEVVGRTRLQKTVALLEISGLGFGFSFDYYKFGPFSEELVVSVDRAVALGYVCEVEKRDAWGGHYSIFKAPSMAPSGVEARDSLINLAKEADAVELELAVTAAFLADTGVVDAWDEVGVRKPEKAHRLNKAKQLYREFLKVDGLPKALPQIA
jgi:uncharacterized protein